MLMHMLLTIGALELGESEDICYGSSFTFSCECFFDSDLYCIIEEPMGASQWQNFTTEEEITIMEISFVHKIDLENDAFPYGMFENFPFMRSVTIEDGHSPVFRKFAFQNISTLETVILKKDNIKVLKAYAISNLPALKNCTLSDNKIEKIGEGVFVNLPNIKILDFRRNVISEIKPNAFASIGSLEELYLDHNKLRSINEDSLLGLQNLKALSLSFNKFVVLENFYFTGLKSLISLELNDNQIKKIYPGTFDDLSNLSSVVLNENRIDHLQPNLFASNGKLDSIDLRHNNLKTLKLSWFKPLKINDSTLDILVNGNPLVCNCDLEWLLHIVGNNFFEKHVDEELECIVTKQFPYKGKGVDEKYKISDFRADVDLCDHVVTDKDTSGDSSDQVRIASSSTFLTNLCVLIQVVHKVWVHS